VWNKHSSCTSSSATDVSNSSVAHCSHCVPEVANLKFMFTWQLPFLVFRFFVSIYIMSASQTCHIKWTLPPDYPGAYLRNLLSCVCCTSSQLHLRWNLKRVKMIFIKLIRWRDRFKQGTGRYRYRVQVNSEVNLVDPVKSPTYQLPGI